MKHGLNQMIEEYQNQINFTTISTILVFICICILARNICDPESN